MKKLLLVAILGLGVHLNAIEMSKEQFKLMEECFNDENVASCQKFIDDGVVSIEKCEGAFCAAVG